jgi:hypothetical protein
MLDLRLRPEFMESHVRETTVAFHRPDQTGALDTSPQAFYDITYPSFDLQRGLYALSAKRSGQPILLLAQRGRGKSHLMAAMHHALKAPEVAEEWAHAWTQRTDAMTNDIDGLQMRRGYLPITVSMQDNEYSYLWDVLFEQHPQGQRYRGRFEAGSDPVPPRPLIEQMLGEQPVALLLDEFQTWFDDRQDETARTGKKARSWAFNFIQNLAEMASERPELLLLVVSVRDNDTDAAQQVRRSDPFLIDFRDARARQDRQRLVLHRIFENRQQIAPDAIMAITAPYREARFHLLVQPHDPSGREVSDAQVSATWPFSPELFTLLEDQILLSPNAQGLRDLIRVLVAAYYEKGATQPILTPASFDIIDSASSHVEMLIDALVIAEQKRLREAAQRNCDAVQQAHLGIPPAEIVAFMSALWMRSIAAEMQRGATSAQLHLDRTFDYILDENAFADLRNQLVANSFNIHQTTESGEARYIFKEEENPRARLLGSARNDTLFQEQQDISFLRKYLRNRLSPQTTQVPTRVIVLGPQWQTDPWRTVMDERDRPEQWEVPALLVVPDPIPDVAATLGPWLARQMSERRNMVRFLLPEPGKPSIFSDSEVIQCARVIQLAESWRDAKYEPHRKEFEKRLNELLDHRFIRFAVLRRWNYQEPQRCDFAVERITEPATKISAEIDAALRENLFRPDLFEHIVLAKAARAGKVGDLLRDLREPPGDPTQEAVVFISEVQIHEQLLRLAARGHIALKDRGDTLICRAGESVDDAWVRLRGRGFKTGRDLAEMLLVLPGAVGGATVGDQPIAGDHTPSSGPLWEPAPAAPLPSPFGGASMPALGRTAATFYGTGNDSGSFIAEPAVLSTPDVSPMAPPRRRRTRRTERKKPTQLVTEMERMAIDRRATIPIVKLEFTGLTPSDVTALLMRLPANTQAILEIETDDPQEDEA